MCLPRIGSECQQRWPRWVSSCSQHRRYSRKITTKSAQESVSKVKYKYVDEMSFVKRERDIVTNLANDGESVDTEDVEAMEEEYLTLQPKKQKCSGGEDQPSTGEMYSRQVGKGAVKETVGTSRRSMTPPKTVSSMLKKYLIDNDKKREATDPIDLFCNAMATTVKKFSPYHQNMCKRKIFSVVSEYELEQILEQIPPAASDTPTPRHTAVPVTVQNTNTVELPYPSPVSYSHYSGESMNNQFQNM